jgi:hypothetical protein
MQKKVIIAAVIVLILGALCFAVGVFLLNSSKNAAQQEALERNPIFHTVPEGGSCVPDRGDCQTGLTCDNGICRKPQ